MFKDIQPLKPQPEGNIRPQNPKYFGMTTMQIGILAGLAAAACLVFGVAGFLILRGGLGSAAPAAPQDTPTPEFTVTPFALPTLIPTGTSTPVSYELLVPEGWVQFKTELAEIWLPKGFKREKATDDPKDPSTLEMTMSGPASQTSTYPVIANVYYEPLTVDSLDTYVDKVLAATSAENRVTERRKITINSVDAIRVTMETRYKNIDATAVNYIFLDGSTVWIVQYFAQMNDFYVMLDTFEKSVRTFRIVK